MATPRAVYLVQVRNRAREGSRWRPWWRLDIVSDPKLAQQYARNAMQRSFLVEARVVPYDRRRR